MLKHLLACGWFLLLALPSFSWGFYAHQRINWYAVFTLPESMLGFYKTYLTEISEHAVDPDKRRYSDPLEGARHYIDIDHYEKILPLDTLPPYWKDAVMRFTEDTLQFHGIVPWHLQRMYHRLTEAFKTHQYDLIRKWSAEIGHYIADACVPLHVTENYNGQLTGQHGIHGLWESRLPELYGEGYDHFTGKADYLRNPATAIWTTIVESFAAKDSVLLFEKNLSQLFRPDRKYEFVQKGATQVRTYSVAYANAYAELLSGMVERRLRKSIYLTGSLWYSAWVDAGQPALPSSTNHGVLPMPSLITERMHDSLPGTMLGRPE